MKSHFYWGAVAVILLVAVYVRFFKLGEIPVSLYWDEAAILADARMVSSTGHDLHGNSWFQPLFLSYGDYKLPIFIWLASLSVRVFGATDFALRFPSALAGVGSCLLAYALAGELTFLLPSWCKKRTLQLITLAMFATSFWSIQFSRTGFEAHIAQFFLLLSLYFVALSKRKPWLLLLSALMGGISVYTYYSVRFVWPPVFMALFFLFSEPVELTQLRELGKYFKKNKTKCLYFLAACCIFILVLIPMVYSQYYSQSQQFRLSSESILQNKEQIEQANQWRSWAGNTLIDRLSFHRTILTLKELALHYATHLSPQYIFFTGDSNLRHGTGMYGLFASILLLPFLFGLYFLLIANKKLAAVLFFWWLFALLPASVPMEVPHALRSLNALFPLVFCIALGSTYLFSHYRKTALFLSLIFCIQSFSYWNYYTTVYPAASAESWQSGYKEVTELVADTHSQFDEVIVDYPDKRLFLWLVAYPYYSASEIQATKKENFEIHDLGNVHFKQFEYSKVSSMEDTVLLVGEASAIEKELTKAEIKPTTTRFITNAAGKPVFFVATFTRPL